MMWYDANQSTENDAEAEWLEREGRKVEERAKEEFPEGVPVEGTTRADQLQKTQVALKQDGLPLFEPAFSHDGMYVRVDILRSSANGGWVLTEVKSGSSVKQKYRRDVAFQKHVLDGAGHPVERVELMYLNRDCPSGDLFTRDDVTGDLDAELEEVREEAPRLRRALQKDSPPEKTFISECKKCDYQERCWDWPEQSLFTLPRISSIEEELFEANKTSLDEIEGDPRLAPHHEHHIEAVRAGEPYVKEDEIHSLLDTLTYPIHFLDFEAHRFALPKAEGMAPRDLLPFQYSLHVLREDGTTAHSDYLHDGQGDPRAGLARSLLNDIEATGSVATYTWFEEQCLESLQAAPSVPNALIDDIIERLWDQYEIFSNWYYINPEQKGSASLKDVLPAVVPQFSYDDLKIQKGMGAVLAYDKMLDSTSQQERERLRQQLLQYCKRDTEAMLEIHRALRDLVGTT